MPGDLQDPTQLFPFHMNKVYEPGTNTFEPGSSLPEIERMVQNLSGATIGRRLNNTEMAAVRENLESSGLLSRPWGDECVQNQVVKLVKSISMSKKVTAKWLILINS